MALKDDLIRDVAEIFREKWDKRDGYVVPAPESLGLGNDGVNLDATVLYADMDGSTDLVDKHSAFFAAEVYKAFLHCAGKVIRAEGGEIRAYDGDRIMGVFVGDSKNTSAVRAALKINYCVKQIINPALLKQYPDKGYQLRHCVGVDTSKLLVARTGFRGANDLVWVGRAANYAAKLSSFDATHSTRITGDVFEKLAESAKTSKGKSMWEFVTWDSLDTYGYRSTYWWEI